MNKHKPVKNRDITVNEYHEKLQLEWLSYRFRALLYEREFEKKKFHQICENKEKTIKGISDKNNFLDIFSSSAEKDTYLKKFLKEFGGFPLFQYRDDYQQKVKGKWDKYFYYSSEDKYIFIPTREEVEIIFYDIEKNIASLNNLDEVDANLLVRKFDELFFEQLWNTGIL